MTEDASATGEASRPLPRRGYLGMDLAAAPEGAPGLSILSVDEGSGAAAAGLVAGDRLMAIDGVAMDTLQAARRCVPQRRPGALCTLSFERAGQAREAVATAAALPVEALASGRVELAEVAWEGYRLRAIWTWPRGAGPHPVVWLLPGLTWLSDEYPLQPAHPVLQLVQGLTAAGFATLRVERSGLGDSEGPPCVDLDLDAELSALRAGLGHLRGRSCIRPDRVFLFGRSLGGMLAPLVAEGEGLRGLAVWGTSADFWHQASLNSTARQLALRGMQSAELHELVLALDRLQTLVYCQGLAPAEAFEREPSLASALPEPFSQEVFCGDRIYGRVASYFQQLQARDVAAAWARVDCSVLAMYGDHDILASADELRRIAELCGSAGRYLELPGVDHHMHQREDLPDVLAHSWGGSFSRRVLEALVGFFAALG